MSPIRSRTFAALLAVLGLGLGAGETVQGQNAEVLARIQRVENGLLPAVVIKGQAGPGMRLADRMRFHNTPGISIAVINNGVVEWARGYGVREAGGSDSVTPKTLFQAASVSKPVAAMAALRLVEQGKLALDQDVNLKLTSWKVSENEFTKEKRVTLRRLVSHSAGLTVHGFRGYASAEPVPTLVQALEGAKPANSARIEVNVAPGSIWRYAGGGYNVLQQLLIDVTGTTFPQLMEELVLDPLGMAHSTYAQPLPQDRRDGAATGHRGDGARISGRWHTYPEMAAAGLWTTPGDLARFIIEVQKAKAGKSQKVLSAEMAAQFLTRQIGSWGLGIELDGTGSGALFRHGGANEGFRCTMVGFVTAGQGVVVMTNSDRGGSLAAELVRSVAKEYGWPSYLPTEKVLAQVDPSVYTSYAGRYELAPNFVLTLVAEGGRLLLQPTGQPQSELFPESETRFFPMEIEAQLTFVKDEAGRVIHLVLRQGGQERVAKKQ